MVGVLAAAILVVNINLPNVIETLCSVAIVWANLAYLLVTVPLLLARLRRGGDRAFAAAGEELDAHGRQTDSVSDPARPVLFAGPMGTAGQRDRRRLGFVRRDQYRLAPRRDLWLRGLEPLCGDLCHARIDCCWDALLSACFSAGGQASCRNTPPRTIRRNADRVDADDPPIEDRWIGQLAPGE